MRLTRPRASPHNLKMIGEGPLRLATIDIGSNAIRLFVGQKSKSGRVRVLEDQRAGIRLGQDAFSAGYIRPPTQLELERVMRYFRDVCDRHEVHGIRAVGTSALRDSSNSLKIINHLKERTGIKVSVINGEREACLLHLAVNHALDIKNKTALLADMGGGSLEVGVSRRGKLTDKTSLPLGTVRLLAKVGVRPSYEDVAHWVRTPLYRLRLQMLGAEQQPIALMIGTGGNLRALGKLCYRLGLSRNRNRFQRNHLEILALKLFAMSLAQRSKRFQLRRDRADVIAPAAVVMLEMMRIFEVSEIQVPNVGLKNGLFWETADKFRFSRNPV
jgi:exopolyphosphatase / guanosine-5'-triphosphate,3'-diphosphate pyrophosphatase